MCVTPWWSEGKLRFRLPKMSSGVNNHEERSGGSKVKVWSLKDELFHKGFVSLNGKNVIVFTNGVEEALNLKKKDGTSDNAGTADQSTESHETARSSSTPKIPEKDGIEVYGEELVGCSVTVFRPKTKMMSEGIVASYDSSSKLHLVVYSDGFQEMLDLAKNRQQAESVTADQVDNSPFKTYARGGDASSYKHFEDEMVTSKKQKVQCWGFGTPSSTPVWMKDLQVPKLQFDESPLKQPKLYAVCSSDGLVDVNGYRVKPALAPILEAIFAKYGDITTRCLYKSASVKASLLEVICNIVQKLQSYDLDGAASELEIIEDEVFDMEASKMRVSWLHEHVAKVRRVEELKEKSISLKKTKRMSGFVSWLASKEMKDRHGELVIARERFKEAEKRANALSIVSRKIESDNAECEAEEYFWRRRMDDLLL